MGSSAKVPTAPAAEVRTGPAHDRHASDAATGHDDEGIWAVGVRQDLGEARRAEIRLAVAQAFRGRTEAVELGRRDVEAPRRHEPRVEGEEQRKIREGAAVREDQGRGSGSGSKRRDRDMDPHACRIAKPVPQTSRRWTRPARLWHASARWNVNESAFESCTSLGLDC